jgi:hypothetical protein
MKNKQIYSPTWRKPVGVLSILLIIAIWSFIIASQWELIGSFPIWVQAVIYLIAGIVWLLPLKPILIWMETGRFKATKL